MARDKWRDYVLSVTEGDAQITIHRKTGVDQGTISLWLNPADVRRRKKVTPETARRFATAYKRPIIEVLLHAGILSEEEAGMRADPPIPMADMPYDDLVATLRRVALEISRRAEESRGPL